MNDFLLMLYWELLPTFLQLIAAILSIFLMRAAHVAKKRWDIEIEARHRDAFHSALMSGIRAAMSGGAVGRAVIDGAILHAGRSVPDAIAALRPAPGVMEAIAEAKLREALEATPFFGVDLASAPDQGNPNGVVQP